MINRWFSRYTLQYPKTLIYMLQSTEYQVGEYLAWYRKVSDFRKVEVRKSFVKTKKSLLLLSVAWVIQLTLLALALSALLGYSSIFKYVAFVFILLASPYILAYLIVIPLYLIKLFVQNPTEYFIVKKAIKKLESHQGIKIAIAGSYGKTSMREILKTVLSEGKKVSAPPYSHNTPLGISQFIMNLDGTEEVLIFELGEYRPGDVRKLCEIVRPDIGVITGINEAHLSQFKTIEKTVDTIFELSDCLETKPLYVNCENLLTKNKASKNDILYSREGIGNLKIEKAKTDLSGTTFTIIKDKNSHNFTSKLLGLHQIGPLACSIALAERLGLSMDQVKKGIEKSKPFDHRLEPKTDASGVITLDDSYNGNPDGVGAVIDFLSGLKNHRRFYVTPGLVEMGAKTKEIHNEIGKKLAEAKIEKVVLIKNSVTPFIEEGLKKADYKGDIIWFEHALDAFSAIPHLTVPGDVVLLQNDWPDQYR